ncbi:MAG TPA: hypothetical protein VG498_14800, partial [Terriglobales bacterium]|nr:hypothetical protein [Terriglobales bacterium]
GFDYGSVVFLPDLSRLTHGNFHPASYRAILQRAIWRKRFGKVLTIPERLQNIEDDRRLCELDSCCSSDALLMNVFCHPRVRSSPRVLGMLGLQERALPIFGWRARVPLASGQCDRTEIDMKFGSLLVESKLTEGSFETCAINRMHEYRDFREAFRLQALPKSRRRYRCYQLLRNVLAAHAHNASFCFLTDSRRVDLIQDWFEVLSAVRAIDLRIRCKLLTWQELAEALPESLRRFLALKYGIGSAVDVGSPTVGY